MVIEWWKEWNCPPIPERALPTIGMISYAGDTPAWAAWLYRDADRVMAWIAYPVSNKAVRGKARDNAFKELSAALANLAAELGNEFMSAITNSPCLGRRYREQAFSACDINITHYIKRL